MDVHKLSPAVRGNSGMPVFIRRDGTGASLADKQKVAAELRAKLKCEVVGELKPELLDEVQRIFAEEMDQYMRKTGHTGRVHPDIAKAITIKLFGSKEDAAIPIPKLIFEDCQHIRRAVDNPLLFPQLLDRQVAIERTVSNDNVSVLGGMVDSLAAWWPLAVRNHWFGYVDTVTFAGGDGKVPSVGAITFTDADTVPDTHSDAGGTLANENVALKTGNANTKVSDNALNDVPGLSAAIAGAALEGAGAYIGAKVFSAIKASATGAGGITEVLTGVPDALPTVANTLGKLDDMLDAVPAAYRPGSTWHLSRKVETLLHKHSASSADYAFDVRDGIRYLRGYPVIINDTLDDGAGADEVSAVFGNLRRGVTQCMGNPMTIGEMIRNKGGEYEIFSSVRALGVVTDAAGVAALVSNDS